MRRSLNELSRLFVLGAHPEVFGHDGTRIECDSDGFDSLVGVEHFVDGFGDDALV